MRRLLTLGCTVLALAGCTVVASEPVYAPGPPPPAVAAPPHIPKGHMPPPGSCRIWFPGRPPGQQPPPGPCERLQYEVPPGAYLVRG